MDQIEDCLSFYLGKAYQRVTQSAKATPGSVWCHPRAVRAAQGPLGTG